MKILIISTCTKSKTDISNPAKDLYTGIGHNFIKNGVSLLKTKHEVDWVIASAGKGLVECDQILEPYNITFQGKNAKTILDMASKLNFVDKTDILMNNNYDLIIVLASKEYLTALQLNNYDNKNVIVVAPQNCKKLIGQHMYLFSPDLNTDRVLFKAGNTILKGKMLYNLCNNVYNNQISMECLVESPDMFYSMCKLNI